MLVNALLLAESSTNRSSPAAAGVPAQLIALLDDTHLAQLVRTPSRLHYDPDFQMAGSDLGIDPPTVLCKPCRALMRNPPIVKTNRVFYEYIYENIFLNDLPAPENWQAHHSSIFELMDCCSILDGGCHLCQLFWHEFKGILDDFRQGSAEFSLRWPKHMLEVCIENDFVDDQTFILTNLVFQSRDFRDSYTRGLYLFFHQLIEAPDYEVPELPSSTSTESNETFAKIASWIGECSQKHATCQQQPGIAHERPTRLVAIENSGARFRLEIEFPENTEYLALSYRWGRSDKALMLKSETIGKLAEWAPTSILSKTIQDACSIVNRLGLRYLWVDRLCIIQDSPDDWSHEASRMAHIYKQAFCTISADGAPDEHGGCFMKRNPQGIHGLKLISSPLADRSGYLVTREIHTFVPQRGGYLANRGWVFQERTLSRRILHFCRHKVYWVCKKMVRDEVSQEGRKPSLAVERPLVDIASTKRHGKPKLWGDIVRLYTKCDLTCERDKLPALSGIAEQMHHIAPDEYLAGMWRQGFIKELCWVTLKPALTFPQTYRAPSWSWASHGMDIDNKAVQNQGAIPMAALSDVSIKLASGNPFGEVQDGWILLSCHLNVVSLKENPQQLNPPQQVNVEFQKEDEKEPSLSFESRCFVDLDFSTSLLKEWATRTYSLPLYYNYYWLYCLLLVPLDTFGPINTGAKLVAPRTQSGREYRRVGIAQIVFADRNACVKWMEASPKKNVVIR